MNGKKIALRLLCLLLMVVNSACHSTQPEGQGKGDAAYQQAMSKARERCENSSFALAELEARKALQLRPSDSEATLLLFTCLKEQSDPKLQEEALKLAQGLSQELEEESDDMLAVQAFIDRVANEDLLAELREAAKEKKPETAELLEKVPSNLRDEAYWRLAFEYQKSAGKKEKAAEAAANWMDYNPTGLLAKEAQFMASRYKSGLLRAPRRPLSPT